MAFPDLAERLDKSKWLTPNLLAEEISAWARSTSPLTIDAPVQVQQQGSQTPIQFLMNPVSPLGDFGPPMTSSVAGGEIVNVPAFPAGTTTIGGGTYDGAATINNNAAVAPPFGFPTSYPESAAVQPGLPTADPVASGGGGGGVGFYGTVVSKTDSRVFRISYYPAVGGGAVEEDFEMPTIADAAVLPAGTAVTAFLYPDRKLFQATVWQ